MRIFWILGGAAVTAVGVLIAKKAKAEKPRLEETPMPSTPDFDPSKTYGETTRVPLAVPAGWRRVTGEEVAALPELRTAATSLRNTPGFTSLEYGMLTPFMGSDGKMYATWVEQHYHTPGGPVKPWGLHHGVTLLTKI